MTTDNAVAAIRPGIVKPLVWSENEPNSWAAIACGFPFTYQIRITDSGKIRTRTGSMEWGYFSGSLDEAKAAAQADYAIRIASALDPAFIERIGALEAENAKLKERLYQIDCAGLSQNVQSPSDLIDHMKALARAGLFARTTQGGNRCRMRSQTR